MSLIKIVADENIPVLDPLFTGLGEVVTLPGRQITRADLVDADVLLVRSVTQIDRDLLEHTKVKFVGTATIGTDHVDQQALQQLGIAFASAPGCNATAVTEYVLSVLLHLAAEQDFRLTEKTVGIVGVGNVGSRLQARLAALGVKLLLCDPPRADREGDAGFVALDALLQTADIITLHTPLTIDTPYPSYHLLNADNLSNLRSNAILINTGRGPVVDNTALLAFSEKRRDVTLVLDVWEHEPKVDSRLANQATIATPHIAGYSLEGKVRGTWMLYQAFCQFQRQTPTFSLSDLLPRPAISAMDLEACASLLTPVRAVYDPFRDDRLLRSSLQLSQEAQSQAFDQLRKCYPVRREFDSLALRVPKQQQHGFAALGFTLLTDD